MKPIGTFDILKFSLKERFRGKRQRKVDDVNIFRIHIYCNLFLLFLSSLPHYQAENGLLEVDQMVIHVIFQTDRQMK